MFRNHLAEEEEAGCFDCVVAVCVMCLFLTVGWSAVFNFLVIFTPSLAIHEPGLAIKRDLYGIL